MVKRKAEEPPEATEDSKNMVEIIPLGAGQEVGRSCIILKYLGKTVMLDCGIHPGFSGERSLPYVDHIDVESVDVMLVTHFHLDHCAAVPWVVAKTKFKGRVLMTHPTKAIYNTLLRDFIKVSRGGSEEGLYSEADLEKSAARIEVVDFHQTVDLGGIKVTAYRAGHVLGAAMFMVDIAGMRCLYTGDYSRVADRHLPAADLPDLRPHIVIVEATYGVSRHLPRLEREQRFCAKIRAAVARGGRVLLPVVALGRAQELLLILEEYWAKHRELVGVPIYQASGLAQRAMSIYQTYIEMTNDAIKRAFQTANPFVFKHVQHASSLRNIDMSRACVVMATPSMLQSGLSREVFDAWCQDPRNCVIIADFAVQGTLAREILGSPDHVITRSGARVPLRMEVDAISFSAHADFPQTSEFIQALQPDHVVLVHGEVTEMMRLRRALEQQAANNEQKRTLHTPKIIESVLIPHRPRHTLKVVGGLADKVVPEGGHLKGLLVQRSATNLVMHVADLPAYTKLQPARLLQRQALPLRTPFPEARLALEVVFEGVDGNAAMGGIQGSGDGARLRVGDGVTVAHEGGTAGGHGFVVLDWEASPAADMVADAIVAVLLQAGEEPPGVRTAEAARRKAIAAGDAEWQRRTEAQLLCAVLDAQFGAAALDKSGGAVLLQVDEQEVRVDCGAGKASSADELLQQRVQTAVDRLSQALSPTDVTAAA